MPKVTRKPDKLTELHRSELWASGLSNETIDAANIYSESDRDKLETILGWRPSPAMGAAMVYSYTDLNGNNGYCRLKFDNPRPDKGKDDKPVKYESPKGQSNQIYLPPDVATAVAEPRSEILLTEGEKKALKAAQEGFPCVGLVGVYGWAIKDKEWLPELEKIDWQDRRVLIVFDSDITTNADVRRAAERLANRLRARGAVVFVVILPSGAAGDDGKPKKIGLDDYLITHSADEFRKLLDATIEESERASPLGLVTLSSVKSKSMEWLWQYRIPRRGPTVIAGEGGVGKTFTFADIGARVSRGIDFPDGAPCQQGRVIYFSAEDDPETILRPRFETHGADLDCISIQGPNAERLLNLADKDGAGLNLLEQAIASYRGDVRLVVFDPLTAFISGKDINRDDEVRSIFRPLTLIAQKHNLAIVSVMHFGKDTNVKAKYRTLGSVGFVNAARAAWAIGKEFEEDAITHFVQTKRNYTKEITGLSFTIREVTKDTAQLVWEEGPSNVDAADLGAGSRQKQHQRIYGWAVSFCLKRKAAFVTDANLQQSGLPGTKGNPDYCRELLQQLAKAKFGTVKQDGRVRICFYPKTS